MIVLCFFVHIQLISHFVLLTLNCARLGFIFHFVLLALNCACLGACSTGLATLASARQVHENPHATVFLTRTKQPRTFPTICSNLCATGTFKAGCQQLPAVPRANTRTSRVDGDTEQIFRTADLVLCITCVLHMHKGFQL